MPINPLDAADSHRLHEDRRELERLREINADLLEALIECIAVPNKHRPERVWDEAKAAIQKATNAPD